MSGQGLRQRPTITDIAKELGLSASTVSRALAGHESISEQTRLRVEDAARDLNYRGTPTSRATASRSAPSKMIGVVVAALHNSFHTHLLDRLHDEFAALGYHIMLMMDSLNEVDDIAAFEPLIEQHLDGILFTTATTNSQVVQELHRRGIPIGLAVRSVDGVHIDTVEVDNLRAGEDAARHLYDLGHRRIGFITGPRTTSTARDRYLGAVTFLEKMGVGRESVPIAWGTYTHESGYSGAIQMLGANKGLTAIVAGNDTVAVGVLEAARKLGLDVPRQLSLIGFDDIPMAGWSMISLTTLRQPTEEMARLAARRLIDRIRRKPDIAPAYRDVLPTNLVQRDTTAPPPS